MKKIPFLMSFIAVILLILGCETKSPTATEESIDVDRTQFLNQNAPGVLTSTNPVITFAGMNEVGTSVLVREDDGVAVKINTSDLVHHHVTTFWWVIFNNPDECSNGMCGEADLFNPAVEPSCLYGDGSIVGGNGEARFQNRLSVGEDRNSCIDFFVNAVPELEGEDHGLLNPKGAEIHIVVRSHGPLIPGLVPEMSSTFFGGCNVNLDPGTVPTNQGECADQQFAVHQPPMNQ